MQRQGAIPFQGFQCRGFAGYTRPFRSVSKVRMDRCSQWYIQKRTRLLFFWVGGNLLLIAVSFFISVRFGIAWTVVAILGFIVGEKLLLRRVDDAAPK
jgi:hypothetical protein